MRITVVTAVIALLLASPLVADTSTGRANSGSVKSFGFTPSGDGQINITLSWLNRSQLVMTLVCGTSTPLVFGSAVGSLDLMASITAGVVAGVPCEIGVTALRGGSQFWMNVLQQTDQSIRPTGGVPRANVQAIDGGTHLSRAVREQLERLQQLSR